MKREIIFKKTFKEYAQPMIIRSVFSSLMYTADRTIAAIFIGASALVATTLIAPLLYLIYGISALFIGGLGAYVGLLIGKNNLEKAKETSSGIILILGLTGLIISLPSQIYSNEISIFLGARGDIIPIASTYLRIISISFPIMLIARGLDVLIYNDGSPKYSFKLGIIVTILNLVLNIFTVAVMNLGIFGLAISTVISEVVMLIGALNYYIFRAKDLKIAKPRFSIRTVVRIAYNGLSDFAMMFVDAVMIFVLNQAFIRYLTPSHFEGYAAANVLIVLFYSIYMGASMGLQPIYSQLMGKREFSTLKELLFYSIRKTVGIGFLVYLFSIPLSGLILDAFVDSPITLKYARFFYISIGFAVMFSNLPLQISSFFTSINRPIESVIISLARTLFLIPMIAYLSIMFLGGIGVAMGYLFADIILITGLVIYMKKVDISKLKIYD